MAGSTRGNTADGGIDWKTGHFNYTNDLTIEIVETLLALKKDGSVVPGSTSIDDPGARERMPQGSAALMFSGPWVIRQWKQDNADFHFGLNVPPQQNVPRHPAAVHRTRRAQPVVLIPARRRSARSSAISTTTSPACPGRSSGAKLDGAADPAAFPAALRTAKLDDLETRALDIGRKYTRLRPDPAARHRGDQGLPRIRRPVAEFQRHAGRALHRAGARQRRQGHERLPGGSEKALEEAISKARSRGAKVTRDDWVFPDWNPLQPYTKLYQN